MLNTVTTHLSAIPKKNHEPFVTTVACNDKLTEAQRGLITCPRPHGLNVVEEGIRLMIASMEYAGPETRRESTQLIY